MVLPLDRVSRSQRGDYLHVLGVPSAFVFSSSELLFDFFLFDIFVLVIQIVTLCSFLVYVSVPHISASGGFSDSRDERQVWDQSVVSVVKNGVDRVFLEPEGEIVHSNTAGITDQLVFRKVLLNDNCGGMALHVDKSK